MEAELGPSLRLGPIIWLGISGRTRRRRVSDHNNSCVRRNIDHFMFYGTCRKGDGRHFPRNPRADDLLARLATDLVELDKDR